MQPALHFHKGLKTHSAKDVPYLLPGSCQGPPAGQAMMNRGAALRLQIHSERPVFYLHHTGNTSFPSAIYF